MFATLNRNLLKSIMLFDGVFSLATAGLLLAFSGPIGGLVGPLATPVVLTAFAVFFLAWGGFHLTVGRQERPSPAAVRFAIMGDALWVLGSVAVVGAPAARAAARRSAQARPAAVTSSHCSTTMPAPATRRRRSSGATRWLVAGSAAHGAG